MSEKGEKEPLLNGDSVQHNGVIDVTGLGVGNSLSGSVSVTSSAMMRSHAAVQMLNHPDFEESSQRPEDLNDDWTVVSAKNAKKRQEQPTSDLDTFIHLLKGNIGTGLLSLPYAVMNGGLIIGPIGLLLLGMIATHCMVLLVRCANTLCKRHEISSLDYSETMQFAFIGHGYTKMGRISRWIINSFLLITQFGFCSVYFVFIADNIQKVVKEAFQIESDPRIWIAVFILPVAVVAWIRFLKELAPASMLANIFMLVGLLIVFYDVFDRFIIGKAAVSDSFERGNLNIINEPLKIFTFLGMVFYSFEGIGVILPLENKMKNPSHAPRVITLGMTCTITLFVLFSVLCYLVYGAGIQSTVTSNLCATDSDPLKKITFLIANLLFAAATFITYHLQFYVPMDFLEPIVLKQLYQLLYRYPHHPTAVKRGRVMVRVGFRTTLVILTAVLAISIPMLDDLISLLGAMASSSLALTFPALLDLLTHWSCKNYTFFYVFPRPVWIVKNILIITIGLAGCGCGTFAASWNIVEYFAHNSSVSDTIICQH